MKNVSGRRVLLLMALLCSLFVVSVLSLVQGDRLQAAPGINRTINFQGKVTNPNGTNVADGSYQFVFRLYTVASGGTATWTETVTLAVDDGIFQHNLGSSTALPGSVDFNTDNIYLGITFNSDPAGEMTPRVRFTASPYAFNADNLDGLDASAFVQLTPSAQQTGSINVSGNIASGATISAVTSLQAPLLDTASAGTLAIGTTNATDVLLQKNTTVASSRSFTVAGGATSLTGAGTGDAFVLSNSTSTGNIAVFRDNVTTVFNMADGGYALFQNTTDSPTAFQILRQGGSALFTADTQNSLVRVASSAATTLSGVALFTTNGEFTTTLRIGNSTDGADFSGSTGPTYRGTARPTRRVSMVPEFPGAVMSADGADNIGNMTSDFCSGTGRKNINNSFCATDDEHNYYRWVSQSGTQDYDIYVRSQIPSDYDTQSLSAVNMFGWRTTANDIVSLSLYNASGGQCGTTTTITTTNTTWTETALANIAGDSDCNAIVASEMVIWVIKVTSSGSTNSALAGAIRYDYRSRF
jgi:hypothetical protein